MSKHCYYNVSERAMLTKLLYLSPSRTAPSQLPEAKSDVSEVWCFHIAPWPVWMFKYCLFGVPQRTLLTKSLYSLLPRLQHHNYLKWSLMSDVSTMFLGQYECLTLSKWCSSASAVNQTFVVCASRTAASSWSKVWRLMFLQCSLASTNV